MKVICSGRCGLFISAVIAVFTFHITLYAGDISGSDFFSVSGTGNFGILAGKSGAVMKISSDDVFFNLPETSTQHVLKKISGKNKTVITLKTGVNSGYKSPAAEEDLASSRFINLSGKEIKEIAALSDGGSAEEKIRKAQQFVYAYISSKISETPIINSNQVIKSRTGDCKQHTVLLIAILRQLKIPARALTGVVYPGNFGSSKNRFVYHMWAEAFDGKKWILCDASFPAGSLKPSYYIAICYHSLKSELPLGYAEAIQHIKNFKIEIKP